ncbi:hypothetical protein P7C71_g3492, partial [Lecanoromycetidae sp. Uapishka_2]
MLIENVAIVGPGGNVGTEVINALLREDRFQITALTRPESSYTPPIEHIKTIATDFSDSSSLAHALHNQDALLCCVPGGATHFEPQKLLIDAAIEAGVKLFFASEYVADITSPHFQIMPTELVGDKPKVRKYLEEKAAEGKIAWTALNGGPFFDMWLNKGVAGFNIAARKATIYGAGTNLACWTPLPIVARAAVTMLENPEKILNRPIFISGVRDVTQNNIMAALEAELGVKFEVEHVNVKKIKEEAMKALGRGEPKLALRGLTLNSQFNEEDGFADFWDKVENETVGVEAVDVREAVREYLQLFGS